MFDILTTTKNYRNFANWISVLKLIMFVERCFLNEEKICSFTLSQAVSSKAHEVVVTVSLLTDHDSYVDDCREIHTIEKYRISMEVECETSCDFDLLKKYC